MSRISSLFFKLKNRSALGIFITAGDPNLDISQKILDTLPTAGADFIELGMPFSDPMADGETIQLSSNRSLKEGINLTKILNMVRNFRIKDNNTPIILMGYFNPIFNFGVKRFLKDSKEVGVDGFIIVDLPPEEDNEFSDQAIKESFDVIKLVTPTSDNSRIEKIIEKSSGFVYYVSVTGITGTKKSSNEEVKKAVQNLKSITKLPVVVGFGIRNQKQVSELSLFSDGMVIGSHIVNIIKNKQLSKKEEIVKSIKNEVKKLSSAIQLNYNK